MVNLCIETDIRGYFRKWVLIKISQNSQKISLIELLFNEAAGWIHGMLINKDSGTAVFL